MFQITFIDYQNLYEVGSELLDINIFDDRFFQKKKSSISSYTP